MSVDDGLRRQMRRNILPLLPLRGDGKSTAAADYSTKAPG
jgi:hypothetical protein